MTVSIILTTYNWPEALEFSLKSILKQTLVPNEIIIADDGSSDKTRILIEKIKKENKKFNIIHSWQEDDGFRAAKSRNLAASKSTSEYLIYIDGDMILDKNFIKDHVKASRKGTYLQGSRVLLNEEYTKDLMLKKDFKAPNLFSKNARNNLNGIYNKYLSKVISLFSKNTQKGIRSCNFSFYKDDFLKVNGFNEDFITWGREDSELISRMFNIGINRKNIKFAGIQYHMYHKEGKSNSNNDSILENVIKEKIVFCKNGMDKYKKEKNDK